MGRKPCVWKLQKKPIFAINILCLTWMCALFLPDAGKGIQTCMVAVKVGQQWLADHSPEMAQVPGNPTFTAMLGSCTDSCGEWSAARQWGYTYPVQLSYVLLPCSDKQYCSIACLIGKEGSFSRGCGVPARRSGVGQRKKQAGI